MMTIAQIFFGLLLTVGFSCNISGHKSTLYEAYPDITVVGAMRNVMQKGELQGTIKLDTITNKKGLYGLGPESFLKGELLIINGNSYVSRVAPDSSITVRETYAVEAPFIVYGNVIEWKESELPGQVSNVKTLERYIDEQTIEYKRPFAFKLIGEVSSVEIHIQNLSEGTQVSSPEEAHQGQVNYTLKNEQAEIIGFFSTKHQGIFTHHDSFLHMHLITKDRKKMGHLDKAIFDNKKLKLYLPVK